MKIWPSFFFFVQHINRRLVLTSHHESGSQRAEIKQEFLFVNKCISEKYVKDFILDYEVIEKDKYGFKLEIFEDPLVEDEYLDYVNIVVNDEILNKDNNNNKEYLIDIIYDDYYIKIEDWVIGVSSELLFNSLLIPSISQKGIKVNVDYDITIGNNTGIFLNTSSNENIFYIMVGDIIIYEQKLYIEDEEDKEEYYEFVIQLQAATPIPASRDDIQIEEVKVREDFFLNLGKLMEYCMESSTKYLILSKMLR